MENQYFLRKFNSFQAICTFSIKLSKIIHSKKNSFILGNLHFIINILIKIYCSMLFLIILFWTISNNTNPAKKVGISLFVPYNSYKYHFMYRYVFKKLIYSRICSRIPYVSTHVNRYSHVLTCTHVGFFWKICFTNSHVC